MRITEQLPSFTVRRAGLLVKPVPDGACLPPGHNNILSDIGAWRHKVFRATFPADVDGHVGVAVRSQLCSARIDEPPLGWLPVRFHLDGLSFLVLLVGHQQVGAGCAA